jgi:hypothetical protein
VKDTLEDPAFVLFLMMLGVCIYLVSKILT